jgi:cyclopropane fatty-acyl-phospholipid synthase-like methyltransferase
VHSLSEACERNKGPILRVLTEAFAQSRVVLEIGSGTGQHAVHFATHLPHLCWQPSDTGEYLAGLREHLALAGPANLRAAIELDVRRKPWPHDRVDALFTANTLHIMGWSAVEAFFGGVGMVLSAGGTLCVYGPFRYDGRYTSSSNADFDRFLQARDPDSGIRAFEAVDALAKKEGLELVADHSMPANNQLLVWRRPPPAGQQ